MKKIIFLSLILLLVVSVFILQGCSSFGDAPTGSHLETISKSKNYSKIQDRFVNRRQDEIDKSHLNRSYWQMSKKFFFGGGKSRKPKDKLPELTPIFKDFVGLHDQVKFIWFGHSTILVNLHGKLILFDPVFSKYASPLMFLNKRFQPAVIKLEELPPIDYIVISHDHYDHLDLEAMEFFKEKKQTKFITPLGVSSYLHGWGIEKERTTELDWWQEIEFDQIVFTCTPAQHFSGRSGIGKNPTLWASWALKTASQNLYFSGDTGYDVHFKQIGDKLGPFDAVFMENGQYNEMWKYVHIHPYQTPKAFEELKGKVLVPIHWGAYDLSLHNWYDPIVAIKAEADKHKINLVAPIMGETVIIGQEHKLNEWWIPLIK